MISKKTYLIAAVNLCIENYIILNRTPTMSLSEAFNCYFLICVWALSVKDKISNAISTVISFF
jgi:hypothetical protein